MTRRRYEPDALYIRFGDLDPANDDMSTRDLSPNTLLLAYNLVRYYGLFPDLYIADDSSADDYVEGLSEAELLLVQDYHEKALAELKTLASLPAGILAYPMFGFASAEYLGVGDAIIFDPVPNPDCNEWIIKIDFVDQALALTPLDITVNTSDWGAPRSSCGAESAIFYDHLGAVVSTIPRGTNPDGTTVTCATAEITCYNARDNFQVTFMRNS